MAQTYNPLPPEQALSPQAWYQQALSQGLKADSSQAMAIAQLEALFQALCVFKQKRQRLLGKWLFAPEIPRGLYLHGGVGRGKSLLMDAFYAGLPFVRKRRLHFHHFMQEIHHALHENKHEADPLKKVAYDIAKTCRVLCFDEFHVSDIADAMILYRLLQTLFAQGVVLVMTSNYAPEDLYPNGLHRDRFLPAIDLIKAELTVLNVDSGHDYRHRSLQRAEVFFTPHTAAVESQFTQDFDALSQGAELAPQIVLNHRALCALRHTENAIWFDFNTLCNTPRSQNDYLDLARNYHTVFLTQVPILRLQDAQAARRFTWLIDVLYDQKVKLFMSAAAAPAALYVEGPFSQEFTRTASRLTEMQSQAYLSQTRRQDKAW